MTFFHRKPKTILMLDAAGAAISALLIGVLLVHFRAYIGLESEVLYLLAAIPVLYVIYDLVAYFTCTKLSRCIRWIAWMNVLYCVFSLSLLAVHHETLTWVGWTYFLSEIGIVLLLVKLELNTVAHLVKN